MSRPTIFLTNGDKLNKSVVMLTISSMVLILLGAYQVVLAGVITSFLALKISGVPVKLSLLDILD